MYRYVVLPLWIAVSLLSASCAPVPEPTRGVLLISIDTLRPDHLGTYGYDRDTSPFLDSLADRGVVFEHAVAHYPNTLASHMSFFTGLYPAEHAVYPPSTVLSSEIPTLPELFAAQGFRTAGFVENGYMKGSYGFQRGFEHWNDKVGGHLPVEIERTMERGLEFLDGLADDDRFFLFLHTYAVHDPYDPPEPFRSRYWDGARPEDAFNPVGPNLLAFNRRQDWLSEDAVRWMEALYDGSIRYADSVLRRFFAALEERDLLDEITIVIISDHGEEFLEHGRLAHTQVYDETLRIPWIVVHPGVTPKRVATLAEGVDLFPTILELGGLEAPGDVSGRSRVPEILSGGDPVDGEEAYGETDRGQRRTLYRQKPDELLQLVETELRGWFGREARFDIGPEPTLFELRSYETSRDVEIRLDGELLRSLELPPDWTPIIIGQGGDDFRRRVEIASASCDPAPSESGRCLGFQVSEPSLLRLELFDLQTDPAAADDLSQEREQAVRRLLSRLDEYERDPVAPSTERDLDPEQEERLRALGYL